MLYFACIARLVCLNWICKCGKTTSFWTRVSAGPEVFLLRSGNWTDPMSTAGDAPTFGIGESDLDAARDESPELAATGVGTAAFVAPGD